MKYFFMKENYVIKKKLALKIFTRSKDMLFFPFLKIYAIVGKY